MIRTVKYRALNKSTHKEQRLVRRKTGKTHLQMYRVADAQSESESTHVHIDFDKVKELYNETDSNNVPMHALVRSAIQNTLATNNENGILIFKKDNRTEYEKIGGNEQFIELSDRHIEDFFHNPSSWLFHTHPALKSSGEGLSVNDIISFVANRNARCDALSVKYGKVYRVERPSDDYAPPLMKKILQKIKEYDENIYNVVKDKIFNFVPDRHVDQLMYETGQYQSVYFNAIENIYKVIVRTTIINKANKKFADKMINKSTFDEYTQAEWVRDSLKFWQLIADFLNLKTYVFDVSQRKSRKEVK